MNYRLSSGRVHGVKSYEQYCALARALDVVGDRWSLLIVRELMIKPSRYTDLRKALPGIATNLLASRLRDLETAGVIRVEHMAPPAASTVYVLTAWGWMLRSAVGGLLRWGAPLMVAGIGGHESQGHWLVPAIESMYSARPAATRLPTLSILVQTDDGVAISVISEPKTFEVALASADFQADVRIVGHADAILGAFYGADVSDLDVTVAGDDAALARFAKLTAHVAIGDQLDAYARSAGPAPTST
ncbi:MAG: putative transcriptional regulator [Pseudonocardiales bacterium]|jgi:DNA-binding HxlR family transcriptional regulator|nr:putative transcriptional regulator [Pseudonocardiales bacterium]